MAQPQQALVPGRNDKSFQRSNTSADHAALVQSRETGDVLPLEIEASKGQVKALPFAKSWVHLMAGA